MKTKHVTCLAALSAVLFCASVALADPFIISVAVGPQSPAAVAPGGTATYTVSLTKTNAGSIDAYLSVSNLPSGATASLSPSPVLFSSGAPSPQISTLTIATTNTLADGIYPFTVTSRDGGSANICTGAGTLIVGNSAQAAAPLIVSISLLPGRTPQLVVSGTPGMPYQLQATATLSPPSWTGITTNVTAANGLFSFTDPGSANHPSRFYRAAKVQ